MSVSATTAMILQCFFNATAGGDVPVMKVSVPPAMVESLRTLQPTMTSSYVGEAGPVREWAFASPKDPAAASFPLLRVSLSDAVLPPSPYAARYGTAHRTGQGFSFETKMSGYCKLLPADGGQQ